LRSDFVSSVRIGGRSGRMSDSDADDMRYRAAHVELAF
jgi:hypothetical protein